MNEGASDAEKAAVVAEAAKARWDLIIAKEPAKAYDFLSNGSKQAATRENFAGSMSVLTYRSAQVEKVECSKDLCRATVRITYDHPKAKGVTTTLEENWVIEDGRAVIVWNV